MAPWGICPLHCGNREMGQLLRSPSQESESSRNSTYIFGGHWVDSSRIGGIDPCPYNVSEISHGHNTASWDQDTGRSHRPVIYRTSINHRLHTSQVRFAQMCRCVITKHIELSESASSTALCLLVSTQRHICANRIHHSLGWCEACGININKYIHTHIFIRSICDILARNTWVPQCFYTLYISFIDFLSSSQRLVVQGFSIRM